MKVLEDEQRLTLEACQGSIAAFETLVMHYEPRIRGMLYSMTQDVELAQDLCQETFLAAYRALPRMKDEALHFAPWLYRIALNQARGEWRRRKHVTWLSLAFLQGSGQDLFDQPGEEYLVSEERFEESVAQRDLVNRVLAQLPATSVTCLLLDAEGFSYREIAEILQGSLSAVRGRLARARRSFQQLYTRLDREERS
jgi:RNA polymerase sigma-70 factor (ECF subfamily)